MEPEGPKGNPKIIARRDPLPTQCPLSGKDPQVHHGEKPCTRSGAKGSGGKAGEEGSSWSGVGGGEGSGDDGGVKRTVGR